VSEKSVQIGIIQSACDSNKEQNINRTIGFIRQAASRGAQIICLQELFSSIYFCYEESYDQFSLAEKQSGDTIYKLAELCKELSVVLVVPYFEKRATGLYHNSAVVIDSNGALLGNYRKQHIPDDPGYYEKFYFTPGDGGYQSFQTEYGKIGVLICWDQWFPEAARLTALQGSEIIFYPTAIGWPVDQEDKINRKEFDAWQTIMRSHAIANGIHVVAVNRTGIEGDNQFWGGSFIADPFGEILMQASHYEEEVHVTKIDLVLSEYYRQRWPFLRDRRTDTYQSIINRFTDKEQ
jgi:N-carbamoylputrescine amidase